MTTTPAPASTVYRLVRDEDEQWSITLPDGEHVAATEEIRDADHAAQVTRTLVDAYPVDVVETDDGWDIVAGADWATDARLADASAAVSHAHQAVAAAREERDNAIRAAREAGWDIAAIARATSMTRQAVYDALAR